MKLITQGHCFHGFVLGAPSTMSSKHPPFQKSTELHGFVGASSAITFQPFWRQWKPAILVLRFFPHFLRKHSFFLQWFKCTKKKLANFFWGDLGCFFLVKSTIDHVFLNQHFYPIHAWAESQFLTLQNTKRRKRRGFGDPRDGEVLLTETLGQMAWAMPTGLLEDECWQTVMEWKQSSNIL